MARARDIPGLSPHDSYASVAGRVVAVRAEEVFARQAEVLAIEDIEALHDMRVATRRLRAALEVFAPCFPRRAFERALREVKHLADALGERRDRDVQIEALEAYAEGCTPQERLGVLGFIEELRAEQRAANASLREALEEAQTGGLRRRLAALPASASGAPDAAAGAGASAGPRSRAPGASQAGDPAPARNAASARTASPKPRSERLPAARETAPRARVAGGRR